VQVGSDFYDGKESRHEQLLALRTLRRGVECRPPSCRTRRGGEPVAVSPSELARELHELIAALDRRVPRVEQAGEAAIARDALTLRDKAVKRLAELQADLATSAVDPNNRNRS
jgi:hypothetical protein